MYFLNKINKLLENNKIMLFVDMDGVISSYDFGNPSDFYNKRPLTTNINTLKLLSNLDNIELYILSVCRKNSDVLDKNNWLDKYAPFFRKDKRYILSKETYTNLESKELKANLLKGFKTDKLIILLDDDNQILKHVHCNVPNVLCIQDSELVD